MASGYSLGGSSFPRRRESDVFRLAQRRAPCRGDVRSFLILIFEQLNHTLHAGGGACDFGSRVGFTLGDDAH